MEIKCGFDDVKWEFIKAGSETVYTCYVTSCNITNRGFAIEAFKGNHKAGRNNDSVKALWFHDTKVHFIPRNLTKIFPNVIYLQISKCELKEISAEDLVGLEKLEDLNLANNDLTILPVDLFKNTKNLKEAGFSLNLIQKFDVKILEPIEDTIEYFGILSNPGINEVFVKKNNGSIDYFTERLELLESKIVDSQRFGDLFSSGKYSDFTIKVQGKEFRVHKGILASLSSVFDKMFSDDAAATSNTFENVRNFSHAAIEEFLRYFYTRTTPTEENATELMQLAVAFDVLDLKTKCESVLVQTIEPQSARQLYNLAVQNSLSKLKRKSFEAIKERHPEVVEFLYEKPKLVNQLIDAKEEFQAKKIKLEKEE